MEQHQKVAHIRAFCVFEKAAVVSTSSMVNTVSLRSNTVWLVFVSPHGCWYHSWCNYSPSIRLSVLLRYIEYRNRFLSSRSSASCAAGGSLCIPNLRSLYLGDVLLSLAARPLCLLGGCSAGVASVRMRHTCRPHRSGSQWVTIVISVVLHPACLPVCANCSLAIRYFAALMAIICKISISAATRWWSPSARAYFAHYAWSSCCSGSLSWRFLPGFAVRYLFLWSLIATNL